MKFYQEQIVKALECCSAEISTRENCTICPMGGKRDCMTLLYRDALALIRELTEDNKSMQAATKEVARSFTRLETLYKIECNHLKTEKANTVRQMREALEMRLQKIPQHHFTLSEVVWCIDNTEKELLEGKDESST